MSTDAWFREFERGEGERLTRREDAKERLRLWREQISRDVSAPTPVEEKKP